MFKVFGSEYILVIDMEQYQFYWQKKKKKPTEKQKDFSLMLNFTGFRESDINVKINRNALEISAKKGFEKKESGRGFFRHEQSASSFSKAMSLPEGLDIKKAKIKFNGGLLEIFIPRKK